MNDKPTTSRGAAGDTRGAFAATFEDVVGASRRIDPHVHRTPVHTCGGIDALAGASMFFKCENLQKVGAFKFRGACNAVLSLGEEEIARGVVTHSSGNHGAAVALAAKLRGARATVVMPANATAVKKVAVESYGGCIVECGPGQNDREETVNDIIERRGATLIHPFDDARVIAGQGTAALELLEQVPDLDVVMTPVGGGGLLGGSALVVSRRSPRVRIIGAEPAEADDTYRSFQAGEIIALGTTETIADGLRTTVGALTFPIIKAHVSRIVRVSESAIVDAMRLVWERMKLVIEPSAAVPVAAALQGGDDIRGKRVGIILSGGNVDLDALPWKTEGKIG